MPVSLGAFNFFLPVFSFLLVFIVIYALITKTKLLGEEKFIPLLISFILASFFIIHVSLVDFVIFSSSWMSVIFVLVFFTFLLLAFLPGGLDFLKKGWVSWAGLGALVVVFIIASSYTFNWAINWSEIFYTDWLGFILVLLIALIVSFVIAKKN
jgi:hypothetical protein